jgi:hypothetical protein
VRQLVIIAVHVLISLAFGAISGMAAHKILVTSLSNARAEMLQSYSGSGRIASRRCSMRPAP